MNNLLSVRVSDRIRDGTHQMHPSIYTELFPRLFEIMVEPDGASVAIGKSIIPGAPGSDT